MTRKHFLELAQRLNAAKPRIAHPYDSEGQLRLEGWRNAVLAVACASAEFNSSFSRHRFFEACGLDD